MKLPSRIRSIDCFQVPGLQQFLNYPNFLLFVVCISILCAASTRTKKSRGVRTDGFETPTVTAANNVHINAIIMTLTYISLMYEYVV